MKEKVCKLCGKQFIATGRNAKYCGGPKAQYKNGTCAHKARLKRHKEKGYCLPLYVRVAQTTGTCEFCGCSDNLSVDHIIPQMIGGNHEKSNLRTLCRSCNSKRHRALVRKALKFYFDAGFTD